MGKYYNKSKVNMKKIDKLDNLINKRRHKYTK